MPNPAIPPFPASFSPGFASALHDPARKSTPSELHMRANSARNCGLERMLVAWVMLNSCRRDWKTESWVCRDSVWRVLRVRPWEAYWDEEMWVRLREDRPGVRRLGVVMVGEC